MHGSCADSCRHVSHTARSGYGLVAMTFGWIYNKKKPSLTRKIFSTGGWPENWPISPSKVRCPYRSMSRPAYTGQPTAKPQLSLQSGPPPSPACPTWPAHDSDHSPASSTAHCGLGWGLYCGLGCGLGRTNRYWTLGNQWPSIWKAHPARNNWTAQCSSLAPSSQQHVHTRVVAYQQSGAVASVLGS